MQVAIVSDIHGNRHALRGGARRHRRRDAPTRSGASATSSATAPTPTTAASSPASTADVCLAGNHDLAVTGELSLDEFSRGAAIAARWTQEVIDPEHVEWLATPEPDAARSAASACTTPARATRSGSTSSARCWPSCASTPRTSASAWSATRTSRCPSQRPEGEPTTGEARRGGDARRPRRAASGCSTPAASASRATAIRAPPGCCSTPATQTRRRWHRTEYDIAAPRGDPGRPPAGLARRAPGVRSVSVPPSPSCRLRARRGDRRAGRLRRRLERQAHPRERRRPDCRRPRSTCAAAIDDAGDCDAAQQRGRPRSSSSVDHAAAVRRRATSRRRLRAGLAERSSRAAPPAARADDDATQTQTETDPDTTTETTPTTTDTTTTDHDDEHHADDGPTTTGRRHDDHRRPARPRRTRRDAPATTP